MMRRTALIAGWFLAGTACDFSGDFLFAGEIDGVPGVQHLGEVVPVDVEDAADIEENTIYGEVGPNSTVELGGVTFTFKGTGGPVCLWVDPETVFWTQSISPTSPVARYTYPDNVFDDGDLDLYAGLSVFYSGSPGVALGDFKQEIVDDMGQTVTTSLSVCNLLGFGDEPDGHAGRGTPEFCTIHGTLPDVSYTAVLQGWSMPLDDDRLGYGLLLTNGTCDDLLASGGAANSSLREECLIVGESVAPGEQSGAKAKEAGLAAPSWLGLDEVPSWEGSITFEETFCANPQGSALADWCEANEGEGSEADCDWTGTGVEGTDRCYCGNPADTPTGGAF